MQIIELAKGVPWLAVGITAGATLLAVVVTSLFNLRVAKFNIEAHGRQRAKELKVERLEELFFLFDKWQLNFSSVYLHHLRCYLGEISFMEVMNLVKSLTILAPGEAQKYRMIMELHFPTLVVAYEPVEAARKHIVPFLSDPAVSKLSAQAFQSCQVKFENACEIFKSKISTVARETLSA